jgi:2-polyprenyl-3-methyl-5-hydroxy-6-metoxy-1,4-benzoquinol methylase
MEATTDRAGKAYWDTAWGDEDWPPDIDPRATKIWGHRDQIFHREIQQTIQDMTASRRDRRLSVLELGCARSAWLPYFVREFGCRVAGLDYSELGARQAAERLAALGISGEIRCADLFAPPADWIGSFDVVAWFGVVEHFEETTVAITAAARYLKPGGVIITEVPNLTGLNGWLQRTLHRPVYDIHVPLSAERLAQSHRDAGLDVLSSRYLVPTDFGVIDLAGHAPGASRTLKERALYPLRLLSGAIWWVDRRHGPLPTGRITSGFVMTVGRKAAPHG